MIKFLLTLWIFLLHIHFASGQPGPFTVQKIRTIDSKDEDFSDLQFLKKTLENKRVVLLGEQSHGDGATFEAKVRLIKFLHQQMDFDLLVFESPMFDNFIAQGKITSSNVATTPLKESIFWLWSETKEFEELIKYVHKRPVPGDTLLIGGFDCQAGDYFNDHYLQKMRQLFDSNNIRLEPSLYEFLERVKEGGAETIIDPQDSANFLRAQKLVYDGFEKVVKTSPSKRNQMMQQTFRSWMTMLAF
ncbi:MAG: hypothetical protein K2U26_00610, partial [Cyclobacteriaceae bacterium]|nr:hypothetical protein [Cyclobacteriaceae bacterium]